MAKSVYSLVLSDEVMELVDRYADKVGSSRSNVINQILAEKVGYETPEKRLKDILEKTSMLIESHARMRFISQPTGSMVTIMSAVPYRYSPAVKYVMEFYNDSESNALGELRVSFRSTNGVLLRLIEEFFGLWKELEQRYSKIKTQYIFENGKFRRLMLKPNFVCTGSMIGEIITDYVKNLDGLMNLFFSNLNNKDCIKIADEYYKNNIANKTVV